MTKQYDFEVEALLGPGVRKLMTLCRAGSPAEALERALAYHGSLELPVVIGAGHFWRQSDDGRWFNESGNPWED